MSEWGMRGLQLVIKHQLPIVVPFNLVMGWRSK